MLEPEPGSVPGSLPGSGELSPATKPATKQDNQSATKPAPQPDNQPATEKTAERRETYESIFNSLPTSLREKLSDEKLSLEILNTPDEYPEGLTAGQKEVITYLKLIHYIENGLPTTDNKSKVKTLVFKTNPPLIKVGDEEVQLKEIVGVKDGNFICQVSEEGKEEVKEITVSADKILEAQRQIVEESTETGIIKASSVKEFLEAQKVAVAEGQQLTEEQAKFNQNLEQLIERVDNHLTIDQSTFAEIIQTITFNSPDTQERIKLIEEIEKMLEEKNQDLINEWAQKVYKEYSPQEIDQINDLLKTGDINSIQELLNDKTDDSEGTKKAKNRARETLTLIKEKAPMIGGAMGILLLLMILQSSKENRGGGGMMG